MGLVKIIAGGVRGAAGPTGPVGPTGSVGPAGPVGPVDTTTRTWAEWFFLRRGRYYETSGIDPDGVQDSTVGLKYARDQRLLQYPSGSDLEIEEGIYKISEEIEWQSYAPVGRVNPWGAGIGNTVFKCTTAMNGGMSFSRKSKDLYIAAGSTMTDIYIDPLGTPFPTDCVGDNLVITNTDPLTAHFNQDEDGIITARLTPYHVSVTGITAVPTVGVLATLWKANNPRGQAGGQFSIDCNHLANIGLFVGRGASKYLEAIRVFDAALDNIMFEAAQNSTFVGMEAIGATRDNFVLQRGPGNCEFIGIIASSGGRSNMHIFQNGPGTQQSGPDKLRFTGTLLEQDAGVAGFVATLWIEDATMTTFRDFAFNGPAFLDAGQLYSSAACVLLSRSPNGIITVTFDDCQFDAKKGYGIVTEGGSAGTPVRANLTNPKYRGQNARPFISVRDDYVQLTGLGRWDGWNSTLSGGLRYEVRAPSTRTFGDVCTLDGENMLHRATTLQRTGTGSRAIDPILSYKGQAGLDYRIDLLAFVDGEAATDCQIELIGPTRAVTKLNLFPGEARVNLDGNMEAFTANDVGMPIYGNPTRIPAGATILSVQGTNLRTLTDAVFNGTTTVTSATGNFGVAFPDVGDPVTGITGVQVGTVIASINSPTSIELSLPTTTSGSGKTITVGSATRYWATMSVNALSPGTSMTNQNATVSGASGRYQQSVDGTPVVSKVIGQGVTVVDTASIGQSPPVGIRITAEVRCTLDGMIGLYWGPNAAGNARLLDHSRLNARRALRVD